MIDQHDHNCSITFQYYYFNYCIYCQEATQKPNPTFQYHRQLIDQLLKRVTNFKWQSEGANFFVFITTLVTLS